MKSRLLIFLVLLAGFRVPAQTASAYTNNLNLNGYFPDILLSSGYYSANLPLPPQVDAATFVNRAAFNIYFADTNVSMWYTNFFYNTNVVRPFNIVQRNAILDYYAPFTTDNTLIYSNTPTGSMYCDYGFVFNKSPGSMPCDLFANQGTIFGKYQLDINAKTVSSANSASLGVGTDGVLTLTGDNVNLSRSVVFAGNDPAQPIIANMDGTNMLDWFNIFGPSYSYNYYYGIEDHYWGAGQNNDSFLYGGANVRMRLDTDVAVLYNATAPYSGKFTAQRLQFNPNSQFYGTYDEMISTSLPVVSSNRYAAHAYFDALSDTYHVVFLPTNVASFINLQWDVRFATNDPAGLATLQSVPVVRLNLISSNAFNATSFTNSLFLTDSFGRTVFDPFNDLYHNQIGIVTNGYVQNDFPIFFGLPGTHSYYGSRPSVYELTRAYDAWDLAQPENEVYSQARLYNPTYANTQVDYDYATYAARINNASNTAYMAKGVTNTLGQIQIAAQNANLTQTRIRADNYVSVDVTNMTGGVPSIEAPIVRFNATFTNPVVTISNLVPAAVTRFNGNIHAYSRYWTNAYTDLSGTHMRKFHVMILDYEDAGQVFTELSIKATNVVVYDQLTVGTNLFMSAKTLKLAIGPVSKGIIDMPQGTEWNTTVFPNLMSLTNEGNIRMGNGLAIGKFYSLSNGNQLAYNNIINSGNITAATLVVRATNLQSTGRWKATAGGADFVFNGSFLGGEVSAWDAIKLAGNSLVFSNMVVTSSAGGLTLTATNVFTDSPGSTNFISVGNGFNFPIKPPVGDLTNTTLECRLPAFSQVDHIWPGADRGLPRAGVDYSAVSNNMTLGRLILNGGAYSTFNLRAAGTNNALYVDVLDLQGNTVINHPGSDPEVNGTALNIDPNLKIYFCLLRINGTMIAPEKYETIKLLTNFVWMPGWNNSPSSTKTPSGNWINTPLRYSKVYDSDHDGVPNFYDATPLLSDAPAGIASQMAPASGLPVKKIITWKTFANSVTTIYYSASALGPFNTVLTTIRTPADANEAVPTQYEDTSLNPGPARFYRVLVELSTP